MPNNIDEQKDANVGHRARIIDTYSKLDLCDLSPQQVLEYILFYVFPRGDVSVLANRLLEQYGSVQNVLDANVHSLQAVHGINERSARLITGFIRIFDYYMNSKMARKEKLDNWESIYDVCESLVRFQNKEHLFVIGLDPMFRVLGHRKLSHGSGSQVFLNSEPVIDFINEMKPAYVVLTHNHPGGMCKPSVQDIEGNETIKHMAKVMHAKFIDHVIVGSDGSSSIGYDRKVRTVMNSEDVKHLAQIYSSGLDE